MTITEQEFFDHACYRFRDGTGRAVHTDHRGRRRYAFAGDDGLRSPVGALIPVGHPALRSRRTFYAMAFIHNDLAGIAEVVGIEQPLELSHQRQFHRVGVAFQGCDPLAADAMLGGE